MNERPRGPIGRVSGQPTDQLRMRLLDLLGHGDSALAVGSVTAAVFRVPEPHPQ